jgi:hypothetical protein
MADRPFITWSDSKNRTTIEQYTAAIALRKRRRFVSSGAEIKQTLRKLAGLVAEQIGAQGEQ